jgi:hypothetical protein
MKSTRTVDASSTLFDTSNYPFQIPASDFNLGVSSATWRFPIRRPRAGRHMFDGAPMGASFVPIEFGGGRATRACVYRYHESIHGSAPQPRMFFIVHSALNRARTEKLRHKARNMIGVQFDAQ